MPDLTLEQVRKARRVARCDTDLWHWRIGFTSGGGELYAYLPLSPEATGGPRIPRDGWYHLPGCDCEFCDG